MNSEFIKGSGSIILIVLGLILTMGGVGGIETNTEELLPLDSLAVALVGLAMFAIGGLLASQSEEA